MALAKKKRIGQSPVDPYQIQLMTISGLSLNQGDASDTVGSVTTAARSALGGTALFGLVASIGTGAGTGDIWRTLPLVFIPLVDVVPAFSRIFRAVLVFYASNEGTMSVSGSPNVVPSGNVRLNLYGLRRTVDTSVISFQYYSTSNAWASFAGLNSVDMTTDPVGHADYNQTLYNQLHALANGQFVTLPGVDIKVEVQYRSDRNQDIALIGWLDQGAWVRDGGGATKSWIWKEGSGAHHYLDIWYVPPVVLHSSLVTAGRPVNIGNVLDAASSDSSQQLHMGFIDNGETGDPFKYWVRNTRTDRVVRRVVIEATRSMATPPVAKSTNVGIATLRSVNVYQLHKDGSGVVDELTPRGAWYIIATSSTQYSIYFQANFTGSFALKGSALNFASDNVVNVSSKKAVKVLAVKWHNTGGITTNDRWDFETASDTTDPNYPDDSRPMMSLIPPTVVGGDVADTALIRPITAITQLLRGGTYTVADGGNDRSVLMLPDTQQAGYAVGRKGYIFDGTGFEAVTIRAIYLTGDALPTGAPVGEVGDAVMLQEELLRSYAVGAFFTTGLYINQLTKASDVFVATGGAAAGQNVINLASSVDWTAANTINVINLVTGQTATYVIQSVGGGGAVLSLSTNLSFSLSEGDLVIKVVSDNAASFFVEGAVPDGAALGDRLALIRVYEARKSLSNIK